jgi:hypothetical protein
VTVFAKDRFHLGDLVKIKIERCNSATLFGTPVIEPVESNKYRIAVNS